MYNLHVSYMNDSWKNLARLYLSLEVLMAVLAPCAGSVGGRVGGGGSGVLVGVGAAHHVTCTCKTRHLSASCSHG